MSYKFSKGYQIIGDLSGSDDANRDTGIDFEENEIKLVAGGSTRFKISGSNGEITFNEAYKFPTADGNADQVLQTNGSGQLSFVDVDGGGGGSSTPQVLKVGLGSALTLTGGGAFQDLQFNNLSFDTFTTGGWDSANYRFVAGETGYYDISATIVFDDLAAGSDTSQYQIWMLSNSDTATYSDAFNFDYIVLANHAPTPSDTDMATVSINTLAHLSASQSASIQVRHTGPGQSSIVKPGKNRTFMCVKKL